MIGFFDSGLGGLTILKEVAKRLPNYSYIYLGDNARTPYGSHSGEIIYSYTIEGLEKLFSRGAEIVILACNTASAVALKKIQQEYLPMHHPDKKVLGIIIPVAEKIKTFNARTVGIFATEATVSSKVFEIEIAKADSDIEVVQQACPLIVPIIESGEYAELDNVVSQYVQQLFDKHGNIEAVILGCTHYPIVENVFRKYISEKVLFAKQGEIVAEKIDNYLSRHYEIESVLEKKGRRIFMTTENSKRIQHLAQLFYGDKIILEVVSL